MAQTDSFVELMTRLRQGDADAASRLYEQYARRLVGLASRHLDGRIRQKEDPEDVAQSVFKSFLLRQQQGRFDLADWGGLWSLLVRMTLHKCGHRVEHYRAACRDVTREAVPVNDESVHAFEALTREPPASQGIMLAELTQQVVASLNDERERQTFSLALEGFSSAEISEKVGRTERTVQRTLARIRAKLERLREE